MSDILCPYEIYDQAGQSAYSSHPLLPDRPDVGGMLGEAGHLRTQHTAANSHTTRRLPLLPIPHGDTDTEQLPLHNGHSYSERSVDATHTRRRRGNHHTNLRDRGSGEHSGARPDA